jgi:hypothetical protein
MTVCTKVTGGFHASLVTSASRSVQYSSELNRIGERDLRDKGRLSRDARVTIPKFSARPTIRRRGIARAVSRAEFCAGFVARDEIAKRITRKRGETHGASNRRPKCLLASPRRSVASEARTNVGIRWKQEGARTAGNAGAAGRPWGQEEEEEEEDGEARRGRLGGETPFAEMNSLRRSRNEQRALAGDCRRAARRSRQPRLPRPTRSVAR